MLDKPQTLVDVFHRHVSPFTDDLMAKARALQARIPKDAAHRNSPYFRVHHCVVNALTTLQCCQTEKDLLILARNLEGYAFRLEAIEDSVEAELRPVPSIRGIQHALDRLLPSH